MENQPKITQLIDENVFISIKEVRAHLEQAMLDINKLELMGIKVKTEVDADEYMEKLFNNAMSAKN